MNIALVSMNASPAGCTGGGDGSGQSVLVHGLAHALAALGHRVAIYIQRADPAAPSLVRSAANVAVALVEAGRPGSAPDTASPSLEQFARGLSAAWNADPPEAIHAFGTPSGQAAVSAARAAGLPVVVTLHPLAAGGRRRDGAFERQASLLRAAARMVATSSSDVFALLGLGASPAAIKFVPCGVDLQVFRPAGKTVRAGGSPVRLATLSGLGAREGVTDVIEALAFVTGVELIVGGGTLPGADILADPDAARLHALARARGLGDRVRFAGQVGRTDVPAFLRAADIVLCAPHDESMGIVALEAMACGVPVIVSAVGGLIDAVADGMTGVHVAPRAPRQLAYAIDALRTDAARRERFGRFGVERARARYGWPRIAAETVEIYRSIAVRRLAEIRS